MRRDRRPASGASCAAAGHWIPALAGGDDVASGVPGPVVGHVGRCLHCQAEVARYRRMVRELRTLRGDRLVPPEGALGLTLRALQDHQPMRRPAAYVGGVVATAAGAAAGVGMLVWRNRRRTLAG